ALQVKRAAASAVSGCQAGVDFSMGWLVTDALAKLISDAGRHSLARTHSLRIADVVCADVSGTVRSDDRGSCGEFGAGHAACLSVSSDPHCSAIASATDGKNFARSFAFLP